MIDHERLMAAIDAAHANSYGSDEQSSLGQKRARAIEAYLGLNNNPAPEGRSQVVDRSVYETISTLMPSLVRIFASSSEEVCKLTPVGREDELAAEQSTAVLNHVVSHQNQWEQICGDWIHDAMLLSNGYAMAYWDKSERKTRETYEGQSDDQVALLMQDSDVRILQHSERPDEQGNADAQKAYQDAVAQWQQATTQMSQAQVPPGMAPPQLPPKPQKPAPVLLHDLVIDRTENQGKVCIQVFPPEHCFVSAQTPNWTLRDCPYFEFRQKKTISALRAMGLKVDEDISDEEDLDEQAEDHARDRFGEERDRDSQDGLMRTVWARMIWVEFEDDGESRLHYVIAVGRTVLFVEPVGRIPVSSMTPQPLPHRHIGLSTADTVIDIQNMKTAVKRGGMDNLYISNARRHVVSDKVSLDDYLNAAPGAPIRLLGNAMPGDGHIVPLEHPAMFGEIIQSLEYFDQERQNRTGASRYFSGTDAGAINKTASGTMALQNMAAMRVEHIARVMAPAVETLFDIVQELISKHQNKELAIKLRGQWVTVDPQAWRTKRDVRISVGVGAGNKESMMAQLQQQMGAQVSVGMPTGLAGPEELYQTSIEIAKLAGFANPDKFWKKPQPGQQLPQPADPETVKAQARMQELQFQSQQDAMKFQAQQQLEQQKLQMQAELDRNREEMDARQKQLESNAKNELEAFKAANATEIERQRLELDRYKADLAAAVTLQTAGMSADVSRETSQPKPDPRVDELLKTIQTLQAEADAEPELIRQGGRAVAVRRGQSVREIRRDPATGKATGLGKRVTMQ